MNLRPRVWVWVLFLTLVLGNLRGWAAQLGDLAAPLEVEWIKGGPVTLAEGKGKTVFVVEFWATWCPPCRDSIPHLTELQKKYKDQGVVFIGISQEDRATVEPFVKKQGDQMDYAVAIDKKDATGKVYSDAFGAEGIPHAFVINKEGKIIWFGHPMDPELVTAIEGALKGEYDPKAAVLAEKARKLMNIYGYLLSEVDEPELAQVVGLKVLEYGESNVQVLHAFAATVLLNPKVNPAQQDLEMALRAATRAQSLTDSKDALSTGLYAVAQLRLKKISPQEAKELLAQARELAKDEEEKSTIGEIESMVNEQLGGTEQSEEPAQKGE